ncbi:metallo-beta-lactamase superfamily, putative [Coleofasciculus chthonoplastes PCC 7420]|uniref:Metallo-beta-lactamase superfamily, putative n=1 Tax=Coleofasciculus chthonoplastes PCC 7420 TaxID=118168 RepID=B4VLD4_9CYAN|nr:MBL fold metallo-hydrolase [Coleofasciculus chthonoplastes]EDX77348.1 metallo-beta-lactamase superfamily, putative [Coleofasciculus chthonoplastes PCC 7420]
MNWKIGNVSITPVIELDLSVDESFSLPDATPENLAPDFDWLQPHFVEPDGKLKFRVQALLVESSGHKIIIDTCVGNDKQRSEPVFNQLNQPFIEDIAKSGFQREQVDIVVCTHLHYDHIGWNTMNVNGEWIPTFPNARYLITQPEFDYCRNQKDDFWAKAFGDSVAPIFAAGLVDLVDSNYQITPELQLIPTPGHTPGHSSVAISSQGQNVMITGDIMHHPCQCMHPEWECVADTFPQQAETTRREFLNHVSDTDILVIGTHWSAAKPVRIRQYKTAWKVQID